MELLRSGSSRRASVLSTYLFVYSLVVFSSLGASLKAPPPVEELRSSRATQGDDDLTALAPGKQAGREISTGQVHRYQLNLTAGQYVRVALIRKSFIVAVITVFGPDGKKAADVETRSAALMEETSIIAGQSGRYKLEVRSTARIGGRIPYQIKIEELRPAAPEDANRILVQQVLTEAYRLCLPESATSRQKALEKYNEAIHILKSTGDSLAQADALFCIGSIYESSADKEKALASYQEALALAQAAGDRFRAATLIFTIGHIYEDNSDEALDYYKEALALSQSSGNCNVEAYTLNNMGLIYMHTGEYQEAERSLNQAIPAFRCSGASGVAAMNNLAVLYQLLGDVQKALNYYDQILKIIQPDQKCRTLVNVGYIYQTLGEWQPAREYYDQSLNVCRAAKDRKSEALALSGIGASYAGRGVSDKALGYYREALAIARETRDARAQGIILGATGLLYDSMGDNQQAIKHLTEGLQLVRAAWARDFEVVGLTKLGTVYEETGEREKALDHFNQALALSQRIGDRSGEAESLFGLARIARAKDNAVEARGNVEKALAIIESLRTKIAGSNERSSYFASVHNYYEFYIDLLMQMHRQGVAKGLDALALEASERARARSLIELLADARTEIREDVAPEFLESERKLRQALNAAAEQQIRLLSGFHTKEQADAIKRTIDSLMVRHKQVDAQISAASPRYAALTRVQPSSVEEIQRKVLDRDTLLLEYFLGDNHSYLWAVTSNSVLSYELPARAEIESSVKSLLTLLTARQTAGGESDGRYRQRVADADAKYWREATALSRTLLGPVASQLTNKRLAIVASGALQYVPFGALPNPPGQQQSLPQRVDTACCPLIVDHEIINLPSASALAVQRHALAARPLAAKTLAVIADPVFEPDDPRVRRSQKSQAEARANRRSSLRESAASGKQENGNDAHEALLRASREVTGDAETVFFSRLLYSRVEANKILSLVADPGQRLSALDFKASRATATGSTLSTYRYLHFATHGLLDEVHPELSGIVLSLVGELGQPQDGFLRLHDIYNLKLSADLVVLSACQTGLGKQIRGEGLVGLTRGFMYAGAPRVVASLWKVQDDATAEFMSLFYSAALREGKRPADALRTAQLEMMKKKQWQSPFFWAAFVLQGEWK